MHDAYYGRRADGSYGNLIEAFQVIDCADEAVRRTVDESDADAASIADAARSTRQGVIRELLAFMADNTKWWLTPFLVVFGLFGFLLALGALGLLIRRR